MARLKNKVAIVTGAASGNGEAIAVLFAKEGASVIVADLDDENGRRVVERIASEGGKAVFCRCDVTRAEDAENVVKTAETRFGGLDVVVNNAGIGLWGTVEEMEPDNWERVMAVNVRGVYLVSKYAIPALRRRGGGAIVNIGSGAGLIGTRNSAAYCASKGAVVNLTRAMALDHASEGIRVNCVCPGVVDTPFNQKVLAMQQNPEQTLQEQIKAHPLGRLARPEEVAKAVLFLASEESSFTTGSLVMVDGGLTAQ